MAEETLSPIVIVDDDADDLFFARRLLTKAAVKNPVITIEGGEEAIVFLGGAIAGELIPCVVFLDIKMPRVDGFDVLRWAREQPALAQTAVVMLSSSGQPKDRERAVELGASAYLVKYPSPAEFQGLVAPLCCHPTARIQTG